MFSSFSSVGFCGSRSLPASAQPLVASVVSTVLSGSPASPAGGSARLVVGCSVGADALVLSSVPQSSLSRVSVFAAFGYSGHGACSLSAVPVVSAAGRGGAFINWWSGGRLNVPLRLRLARRTLALVRFLARRSASHAGGLARRRSALVCFLASPKSRGSLLACRLAARFGVSVFVFCIGFSPSRLPRLGRGSWSLVPAAGLPAGVVPGSSVCQWSPCPQSIGWTTSLKKGLKKFYEAIISKEHNSRHQKHVKRFHQGISAVSLLCLVLFSIILAIVLNQFVPVKPLQNQQSQFTQYTEPISTAYQELLLQFDNENESARCLSWLNTTPAKQLRITLKKSKVHSNRIDTLLSHRPYSTWTEILYQPKIGTKNIETIVTTWRNVK